MRVVSRWVLHLWARLQRSRRCPDAQLQKIEAAVEAHESLHPGEIRVVVEAGLELDDLLCGLSSRARALELFASLGVWDTEANNGVLIYLLLADQRVEIVADRAAARGAEQAEWDACCRVMEPALARGDISGGVELGLQAVAALLHRRPSAGTDVGNEFSNAPIVL